MKSRDQTSVLLSVMVNYVISNKRYEFSSTKYVYVILCLKNEGNHIGIGNSFSTLMNGLKPVEKNCDLGHLEFAF